MNGVEVVEDLWGREKGQDDRQSLTIAQVRVEQMRKMWAVT